MPEWLDLSKEDSIVLIVLGLDLKLHSQPLSVCRDRRICIPPKCNSLTPLLYPFLVSLYFCRVYVSLYFVECNISYGIWGFRVCAITVFKPWRHGLMMIRYDYSIDISILLDYLTARANMNMVLVVSRQSR